MFITAKIVFVFICILIVEQKERSTTDLDYPGTILKGCYLLSPIWPCIQVPLCNLRICYFLFLGTSNQRRPFLVPGVAPEWLLYQITFVSVIFLKRNIYSQGSQGCHRITFYTAALVSIIFRDITKKGTLLLVSRMFHEKVFLCITFVITALI